MEKVSVSRSLLAGIVAVAAAALLAVAFLLGRASGSVDPAGPAPAVASPAVAETADAETGAGPSRLVAPAPEPAPSLPAPAAVPFPSPVELAPTPSAGATPAPARIDAPRAGSDPERAGVAAYLDAVDRIQPGTAAGSPESLANEMASALANGDTSGLDRMIGEMERARGRLAALAPPAACAAHQRESLASLDDGLEVLRALGAAVKSSEPAAGLADVASRATSLRSRAEALQREELALRERYGLPR